MIRLAAPALALLAATEAAALTCAVPDPLQAFRTAQDAPETYHALYGTLSFDPRRMPQGTDPLPRPDPVEARFSGFALGLEGFTRPVEALVTLRPACAGPWCGSILPGTFLLFAEPAGGGYVVEIGPCGGRAFDQVPEATLGQLAACMRGQACGD